MTRKPKRGQVSSVDAALVAVAKLDAMSTPEMKQQLIEEVGSMLHGQPGIPPFDELAVVYIPSDENTILFGAELMQAGEVLGFVELGRYTR